MIAWWVWVKGCMLGWLGSHLPIASFCLTSQQCSFVTMLPHHFRIENYKKFKLSIIFDHQ